MRTRKEPYALKDFLLRFGEERSSEDSVDDLRARFRAVAAKGRLKGGR